MMDIVMVPLVRVGTKRSLKNLHIVHALAFRTWLGLANKLQAKPAQSGQYSAGTGVALDHFKLVLHVVIALERCFQAFRHLCRSYK